MTAQTHKKRNSVTHTFLKGGLREAEGTAIGEGTAIMATTPLAWRGPAQSDEVEDERSVADGPPSPRPRRSPRLVELDNKLVRRGAITKENARDPGNEPPNLAKFRKAGARGPTSDPAIWFQRMTNETWDDDIPEQRAERAVRYEKERMRWRGWVGRNEERVEQRRNRCGEDEATAPSLACAVCVAAVTRSESRVRVLASHRCSSISSFARPLRLV